SANRSVRLSDAPTGLTSSVGRTIVLFAAVHESVVDGYLPKLPIKLAMGAMFTRSAVATRSVTRCRLSDDLRGACATRATRGLDGAPSPAGRRRQGTDRPNKKHNLPM